MSSQAEVIANMTDRASRHSTKQLCEALSVLDRGGLDEAERMTRAVLIDVLCARHPEADAAFDAWASDEPACASLTAVQAITGAALAAANGRQA